MVMPKLIMKRFSRMKRKRHSAHVRWKRRRLTSTPLTSSSHHSTDVDNTLVHSPITGIRQRHNQEVEDEEEEEEVEQQEEIDDKQSEEDQHQGERTQEGNGHIGDLSESVIDEYADYASSDGEPPDHQKIEDPFLNQQLKAKAQRTRLTVRNVKSIIKNIITNEKVVAMVQQVVHSESVQSTGSNAASVTCDLDSTVATADRSSPLVTDLCTDLCTDTRVTRSRARQLLHERQLPLAVHLATPVKRGQFEVEEDHSPSQQQQEQQEVDGLSHLVSDRLLSSDDDTDDEYTPRHTPARTASPEYSPEGSPSSVDWASTPGRLSVAPSTPGSVLEDPPATRTRSRLPLNDQPLELLAQMLDPPDVTPDMYQPMVEDEEWCSFLQNFNKPLTENTVEDDDDEEYMFQMDEEELVEKEELRSDPAARISRREVNQLISELFKDVADLQQPSKASLAAASRAALLADFTPTPTPVSFSPRSSPMLQQIPADTTPYTTSATVAESNNTMSNHNYLHPPATKTTKVDTNLTSTFSHDQLRQLHVQMSEHVQLLAQTYLLSAERQWLQPVEFSCRTLLVELSSLARAMCPHDPRRSCFWPVNLNDALHLLARVDADGVVTLKPEQEKRDFYVLVLIHNTTALFIIAILTTTWHYSPPDRSFYYVHH